jgi:hypothetical protein
MSITLDQIKASQSGTIVNGVQDRNALANLANTTTQRLSGGTTAPQAPQPTQPTQVAKVPTLNAAPTTAAGAFANLGSTLANPINSYDLYNKELQSRGINTLIKQESQLSKGINAQQNVLEPLLPQNSQYVFPKSLKELQDVGVNQDQLNLLAAKAAQPVAQGLKDLLMSRSIVAQEIDRQTQLSQYAVGLQQKDYELKLQVQQLQYGFAKELEDGAALKQKEAKEFAIDKGITLPFYSVGGTVYQTSTGKAYATPTEAAADGVDINTWSNVQKIEPDTSIDLKKFPVSYQEYMLAKSEGYKGTYNDYQTMDANRKAVRSSTTINYGGIDKNQVAQENRVKQIIAAHPGEWGNAAENIDREFGAGTATKYDDLLKAAFDPNTIAAAKKAITPDQQSIINDAQATWDAAKQLYQATPELRQQIIDQSIRDYNFDPSPFF